MIAYRVTIKSDTDPERCLGYRSQHRTAKILAKEYMKDNGAINESWSPEEAVHFFVEEVLWTINFEEINIEY